MNDWDKNNLDFIMSLQGKQLDKWMDWADSDDIAYALELIDQQLTALNLEILETQDSVDDLTLANKVINRFKLCK
jgi:hypothetical protein